MATNDKTDNEISKKEGTQKFVRLKTISLFSIFLVLGMGHSVLGTTMTHVEELYGFKPEYVSIVYFGYTVGALGCGLLIGHLDPVKSFIFFNTMMGASLIVTIFSINGWMFIGFMTSLQIAAGFIDAAGQSYGISLWLNLKFKNSLIQVLHTCWSLGCTIGSYILNKFLCEIQQTSSEDLHDLNTTTPSNLNVSSHPTSNTSLGNDTFCRDGKDIETTKHAYILSGSIVILFNLPFVIVLILTFMRKKNSQRNMLDASKTRKLVTKIPTNTFLDKGLRDKLIIVNVLIFSFMFAFLYTFSESPMMMMITSFGVKHLKWSVSKSGLLLTLYYSTHMSSRVVNIFLYVVIRPGNLLLFALAGTLFSSILMCFVDYYNNIMWPAIALIGYSLGTLFPGIVVWLSENTKLDGRVGAALVTGIGSATIIWPHILNHLISKYNSLYYIYMIITAASIQLALFTIQRIVTRFMWRSKATIIQHS